MTILVAMINSVDATFVLALAVLAAGVYLSAIALKAPPDDKRGQQVFAAVGVLFGLLAAGGIGTLFAQQTAHTAEKAAVSAGEEAATTATEAVPGQVKKAVESAESSSSGSNGNKSEGGGAGE